MADSIFTCDGGLFTPTEHARGPWDPRALHGGAPAALIAAAFERMQPGAELRIARLGFEFLRPVPLAPLRLSTRIVRPGRRVQELAAELSSVPGVRDHACERSPDASELICRASALRVQEIAGGLPAPAGPGGLPATGAQHGRDGQPQEAGCAMDPPESGQLVRFALDGSEEASFAASMDMRWLSEPRALGAGRVWMLLRHPLLRDEQTTPLARLAAAADFGNGVSAALPFDRFVFINADLTIHLQRSPRGAWIGLDSRTLLVPGGTGLAESVLHDERGAVGRAFQTLVVEARPPQ